VIRPTIFVLDSLGKSHHNAVRVIASYLLLEAMDKKGSHAEISTEGWGKDVLVRLISVSYIIRFLELSCYPKIGTSSAELLRLRGISRPFRSDVL
jgi:hypothetical protein